MDGVTQAPGVSAMPAGGQQLLYILRGADFTLTTDQAFTKIYLGYACVPQPTSIIAVCTSGAFSGACIGGIYSGPGKTGMIISSATQSWSGLTGPGYSIHPAAGTVNQVMNNNAVPYLSLTIGNGAPLTCDLFIFGPCID
jgi:hypothetical protein